VVKRAVSIYGVNWIAYLHIVSLSARFRQAIITPIPVNRMADSFTSMFLDNTKRRRSFILINITMMITRAVCTPTKRFREKILDIPRGSRVTSHPRIIKSKEPGGGVIPRVIAAIE
jgi:hypothetical protein